MDDFKYNDSLWGAAMNGNIDRVREILSDPAGIAQINHTNKYGYTPLQVMTPGSPEILQILLESGANPNVQAPPQDTSRRTPLHDAINHGNEENAKILMQYGADVTVEDAWGNTPLHLAAKHSSIQVLSAMNDTGQLQPDHYQARNNEGISPLNIAKQRQTNDRQEIIDFIQAHVQPAPAE